MDLGAGALSDSLVTECLQQTIEARKDLANVQDTLNKGVQDRFETLIGGVENVAQRQERALRGLEEIARRQAAERKAIRGQAKLMGGLGLLEVIGLSLIGWGAAAGFKEARRSRRQGQRLESLIRSHDEKIAGGISDLVKEMSKK